MPFSCPHCKGFLSFFFLVDIVKSLRENQEKMVMYAIKRIYRLSRQHFNERYFKSKSYRDVFFVFFALFGAE